VTWLKLDADQGEVVRAMTFARAWAATTRGDDTIPSDPYQFEHPAIKREHRDRAE
jgi:hypothetical protein